MMGKAWNLDAGGGLLLKLDRGSRRRITAEVRFKKNRKEID